MRRLTWAVDATSPLPARQGRLSTPSSNVSSLPDELRDGEIAISYFATVNSTKPEAARHTWPEIVQILTTHTRLRRKDAGRLFSPVEYEEGHTRAKGDGPREMTLAVTDHDHGDGPEVLRKCLDGLAFAIYTTHSHTPEDPRLRAVVLLAEPVPVEKWPEFWERWCLFLEARGCHPDRACPDAKRMYYLPAAPPDAEVYAAEGHGAALTLEMLPELPPKPPAPPPRSTGTRASSASERYPADAIVAKYIALAGLGNRNKTGMDLAVQLQRNLYTEAEAEGFMLDYQRAVELCGDHPYTASEALETLRGIYSTPATGDPWTLPGSGDSDQRMIDVNAGTTHDNGAGQPEGDDSMDALTQARETIDAAIEAGTASAVLDNPEVLKALAALPPGERSDRQQAIKKAIPAIGLRQLRAAVRQHSGEAPAQGEDQAAWMVRHLLEGKEGELTLYVAPDQTTYVRLNGGDTSRTWPVKSSAFRQFVTKRIYEARDKMMRGDDLKRIIDLLDAQAACDGLHEEAYLRVAPGLANDFYIDLRNDAFEIVHVTADDWEIISSAPVLFRRGRNSLAMPHPQRGGDLSVIRKYVNLDDDQWVLFASCLCAYMSPFGPYPVLAFSGEQGAGKSTGGRVTKKLIDPALVELYSMPDKPRDVFVAAQNNWLIAYDNLSEIPSWLADVSCALATGGGISSRELYTDSEEHVIKAKRPLILNGIPDIVTRNDLLSRAIPLTLKPIKTFRTEETLNKEVEADLPVALGGLLDACVAALRNRDSTIVDPSARMADFARWAAAASTGLGWSPATFFSIYHTNRATAEESLIESDPIANAIIEFAKSHQPCWEGTMTDLYQRTTPPGPRRDWPDGWPGNPRALSASLQRLAGALRRQGVDYSKRRTGGLVLHKLQRVADNGGFATLNDPFATLPDSLPPSGSCSEGSKTPRGQQNNPFSTCNDLLEREKKERDIGERKKVADFATFATLATPEEQDESEAGEGWEELS